MKSKATGIEYEWMSIQENQWLPARQMRYQGCCDCGLVHVVKWKVKGGNLYMKWARDKEATRMVRRNRLHK
jgi:hypothetical protein